MGNFSIQLEVGEFGKHKYPMPWARLDGCGVTVDHTGGVEGLLRMGGLPCRKRKKYEMYEQIATCDDTYVLFCCVYAVQ